MNNKEPDYFVPTVMDASDKFGRRKPRMKKMADAVINRDCSRYLIKGLMNLGDFCAIGGAPGSGKTFAALLIGTALSTGAGLFDRRVRQAPVFFIVLEGAEGFESRVCAFKEHFPDASELFFYDTCTAAQLRDPEFVKAMLQNIADYEVEAVFIDTLARYLGDADENTNAGMAQAMKFADEINEKSGAAVLFIAHTGKDATKGLRGHSSLRGALDVELIVENSDEDGRTIKLAKVKDGPEGERFTFALEPVDFGDDVEGDPIRPCVVKNFVKIDGRTAGKPLTATEQKWFDAINEFFADGGGKQREIPSLNYRKIVSGNIAEIRECFQRIGMCPGPIETGNNPETESERKARERRNAIALSKWAGALRRKEKIGYDNGLIWLVEGAQ